MQVKIGLLWRAGPFFFHYKNSGYTMKMTRFCLLFLVLACTGCMKRELPLVLVDIPAHQVSYLGEVKPILDKRCVVCHSCYNSPCQLKLSSYEGLDRGASKKAVYNAKRLKTMDPSRLFTDALTTAEWREKEFFSVTENGSQGRLNDSIMLQLLSHKMANPVSKGEYFSEADDLTCSANGGELSSYLQKHPNGGMPFGFPPLKKQEFSIIAGWIAQGANGPDPAEQYQLETPSQHDAEHIKKWEIFLNKSGAKHVMTARYLYEHFFLAHVHFGGSSTDFFEIIRSSTPPGEPLSIIPTVRPYDSPGGEFYYRFRKIHSTIVYKTHMVVSFDDAVLQRYHDLFITPDWLEEPHVMDYGEEESADPFLTFEQIPPLSRYRFLLDNVHYIIMTFIRGPVCKGQVALNVINDHFWLFFLDPEADLTVKYPAFLKLHREKLRMPAQKGSNTGLLKALTNPYHDLAMEYNKARQDLYMTHHYKGIGYEAVWKGERLADAPVLTVFRHFDSASVHRGALGDLPKTLWVIDYPLLERIYYSLVAGFDVYGNAWHQLSTRLYMDALRREGESNFLDFLPRHWRLEIMQDWYRGMDFFHVRYQASEMPAAIQFVTDDPKREFAVNLLRNHFPEEMGLSLDPVNFQEGPYPNIPEVPGDLKGFLQALHSASAPGSSFFTRVSDHNANVAYIRIKVVGGDDLVISAVIHRWHDNVTFLFGEKNALDPVRDTADFFEGFIGSYPNYFFVVDSKDVAEFAGILANYRGSEEDVLRLGKFGVNRSDENFWEAFDWFQERFLAGDPLRAGFFDLNRYYHKTR
ncbi:MAG: fatty acid cis/trans isomerase [Desulfopila sp.]|jgi:hypothetical protein|nr:fatty acid cis/trans isomerase [Desulfopila sp.]